MQPTAFCNIDCEYCYLPNRRDRTAMPIEIVRAAASFIFDAALNAPDFTVVWHAGEPLVMPPDWYRRAIDAMQDVAPAGLHLPHAIQTNGLLINAEWCKLFIETGMRVGVSLDGPAHLHDARRRTRSGKGTHSSVMRGIDFLRRHRIPFHVICVIGRDTLDAAGPLMDFFEAEKIEEIGFNVEEIEGPVATSTLQQDPLGIAFRRFFGQVLERANNAQPLIRVREHAAVLALMEAPLFGRLRHNAQNIPFGIVTVSARGQIFTFSPELAGLLDEQFGDFVIGALPQATLEQVLASPSLQAMWRDIEAGVRNCLSSCAYFDLCQGGAPSNKLAENGTFSSTETMYCRLSHKAVADVVLAAIEAQVGRTAAARRAGPYISAQ